MLHRLIVFFLLTACPAIAAGKRPLLILTVNLSKSSITVQKNTRKSHAVISDWIVPVAPGTIRPGTYKLIRHAEKFRTKNGNVELLDVIRTDGRFNLRKSEMFETWILSGRPANRAIVMRPQMGSMLFTIIDDFGLENVRLRVIPH